MERPHDAAASLLFSFQFFVDRISLPPAGAAPSDASKALAADAKSDAPLVGFRLLQYEIVLFDRRQSADGSRLVLEHGKSCLFEAEPAALAAQLRDESAAPLVLLLMIQERDRARLVAFASVTLPPHVSLLTKDDMPADMKYRVCEWARGNREWELRNHSGDSVGKVTGAVTLSCLGKSLAPHLANALGSTSIAYPARLLLTRRRLRPRVWISAIATRRASGSSKGTAWRVLKRKADQRGERSKAAQRTRPQ